MIRAILLSAALVASVLPPAFGITCNNAAQTPTRCNNNPNCVMWPEEVIDVFDVPVNSFVTCLSWTLYASQTFVKYPGTSTYVFIQLQGVDGTGTQLPCSQLVKNQDSSGYGNATEVAITLATTGYPEGITSDMTSNYRCCENSGCNNPLGVYFYGKASSMNVVVNAAMIIFIAALSAVFLGM